MGEIVPLHREPEPAGPASTENLRRLERSPAENLRRLGESAEPLWRELVGDELRALRRERGERLVDVAERAGFSPQYLSEVERGLKDPSSEMLAAVAGSLGLSVRQLTVRATRTAGQVPGGTLCLAA
jgi:hypothetical protein